MELSKTEQDLAFGDSLPSLVSINHIICADTVPICKCLQESTRDSLAGWGVCPEYNIDGTIRCDMDDNYNEREFSLWSTSQNQSFLISGIWQSDEKFGMILSIDTPQSVLLWLDDIAADDEHYEYYKYMAAVPDMLRRIPWMYIPIHTFKDRAMFVYSNKGRDVANRFIHAIKSNSRSPVYRIVETSEDYVLNKV